LTLQPTRRGVFEGRCGAKTGQPPECFRGLFFARGLNGNPCKKRKARNTNQNVQTGFKFYRIGRRNRAYRMARAISGGLGLLASPRTFGVYFAPPAPNPGQGGGGGGGGAGGGGSGGAGGGGAGGSGGGDGGDDPPPDVVPRSELVKATQRRDAAKAQLRGMLNILGYDPAHTRIEQTDDEDNPFRILADGEDVTDEVRRRMSGQTRGGGSGGDDPPNPPTGKVAQAVRQAEQKMQRRIDAANELRGKNEGGLIKALEVLAVVTPLRAAFARLNAVDSGGEAGEYRDAVELAMRSVRAQVKRDPDTHEIELDAQGNAVVEITPLKADGNPLTDNQGKTVTLAAFAESWLKTRPNFQKNAARPGPGAGGHGGTGSATGKNGQAGGADAKQAAQSAGRALFGLGPVSG
jgi:hypothetical protein